MSQVLSVPVSDRDHSLGPAQAPVTLVEYGDFECPHCEAAFPVIRGLLDTLGGRVRFVFRPFPITGCSSTRPGSMLTRCRITH